MAATRCWSRTSARPAAPPWPISRCRPTATPVWRWGTPCPSTAWSAIADRPARWTSSWAPGRSTPIAGRFISREHYLMYRPEAMGIYARVGRFFAPFGLRLAEHYTLRPPRPRLQPARGDLQPQHRVPAIRLGASRHRLHSRRGPEPRRRRRPAGPSSTNAGSVIPAPSACRAGTARPTTWPATSGGVFIKSYLESTRALFQTELNVVHSRPTSGGRQHRRLRRLPGHNFHSDHRPLGDPVRRA